jgi:hypothetical protein
VISRQRFARSTASFTRRTAQCGIDKPHFFFGTALGYSKMMISKRRVWRSADAIEVRPLVAIVRELSRSRNWIRYRGAFRQAPRAGRLSSFLSLDTLNHPSVEWKNASRVLSIRFCNRTGFGHARHREAHASASGALMRSRPPIARSPLGQAVDSSASLEDSDFLAD